MHTESERKPLCVVLDTNQWEAHTMLRSHLAAALIHLLERHRAVLAIPEVIATEVQDHLVVAYRKVINEISSSLGRLRMILARSPDPELPAEEAAREALRQRLDELGSLVLEVPASDRHFISAGRMVLSGLAPNAKGSQQFKDCLLWQAVLDLTNDHEVLLVTSDGGFYESSKSDALHPDLSGAAATVRLVRTMEGAVSLL